MLLSSETENGVTVVKVAESRIDASSAVRFKDAMREETDNDAERVVLNLSEVAFIDSSGLGAIVASMKQLGSGRKLELAGLTPDVGKVFRLTRMDSIFQIHNDVSDALALKAS